MPNDHYIGVIIFLFILGIFAGAVWFWHWLFTSMAAKAKRRDRGERIKPKDDWLMQPTIASNNLADTTSHIAKRLDEMKKTMAREAFYAAGYAMRTHPYPGRIAVGVRVGRNVYDEMVWIAESTRELLGITDEESVRSQALVFRGLPVQIVEGEENRDAMEVVWEEVKG